MDRIARRRLCAAALGGAALAALPARPQSVVRLVVAGSPGSTLDQYARRLAEPIGRRLGLTLVVDNRSGADGLLALEAAAQARADGRTLLLAGLNALCIAPGLDTRRALDPRRAFAPVSLVAAGYPLLLARASLPAATLGGLFALGRSRADPLRCGAPALASLQHLAAREVAQRGGLALNHVAYAAQSQVINDLVGGHIDLTVEFPGPTVALVQAKRLQALAVLGPTRKPALPELATAAEQGEAGLEAGGWAALLAPAGLPRHEALRWDAALQAALDEPALVGWMAANGSERLPAGPDALATLLDTELVRWGRLAAAAGLRRS